MSKRNQENRKPAVTMVFSTVFMEIDLGYDWKYFVQFNFIFMFKPN